MKTNRYEVKYRNYKRYQRKFISLSKSNPSSTKLIWLKKRITKLHAFLSAAVEAYKLKTRRIASAGMLAMIGASGALAQSFEYKPNVGHPFEGLSNNGDAPIPKFVDFDGDGDEDLFVSYYAYSEISDAIKGEYFKYFENVEGIYEEKAIDAADDLSLPNGLSEDGLLFFDVIDYDNDGDSDIFMTDLVSGKIEYLVNNDDAFTLDSESNPFTDIEFQEVNSFVLGDVDGDGDFELIVDDNETVTIFDQVDGKYEKGSEIITTEFARLDLHDIDADGDLDLMIANKYGVVSMYENVDGVFSLNADHILSDFRGNVQSSVAFSDIDGDGDEDLLTSSGAGGFFFHKFEEGEFVYVPYNEHGISFGGADFVLPEFVDMDGDGDQDLVYGSWITDVGYSENIEGIFTPDESKFAIIREQELGVLESNTACADYDNDGDIDCIVNSNFGKDIIPLENVDGSFVFQDSMSSPFYDMRIDDEAKSFAFEDFDNDGDLDIFIGNKYGQLNYFVNNDGVYEETTFELSDLMIDAYTRPIFADLDRDGDNDLLMLDFYGALHYFEKDGGVLTPSETNPFPSLPEDTYDFTFFDRDDDGDLDALVATFDGRALYFQNNDLAASEKEEVLTEDAISIFPNPAQDLLNVRLESIFENPLLEVFSIDGRRLHNSKANQLDYSIDVSHLKAGNYLLKVTSSKDVSLKKFSIAK